MLARRFTIVTFIFLVFGFLLAQIARAERHRRRSNIGIGSRLAASGAVRTPARL